MTKNKRPFAGGVVQEIRPIASTNPGFFNFKDAGVGLNFWTVKLAQLNLFLSQRHRCKNVVGHQFNAK